MGAWNAGNYENFRPISRLISQMMQVVHTADYTKHRKDLDTNHRRRESALVLGSVPRSI